MNVNHAMLGKAQHSDKVSLPSSLGRLIFGPPPFEVPWLFEITPVLRRHAPNLPNGPLAPNTPNFSPSPYLLLLLLLL